MLALEKMRSLPLASVYCIEQVVKTSAGDQFFIHRHTYCTHALLNESKQTRPISNASTHPHTCTCMTAKESVCVTVWHGMEAELRTGTLNVI